MDEVVWDEVVQGRRCIVKRISPYDTQAEEERAIKRGELLTHWYCGYVEIAPSDGEVYEYIKSKAESAISKFFPHALWGITWTGEIPGLYNSSSSSIFIGFDTAHPSILMKPATMAEVINAIGLMIQDLYKFKEELKKRENND